MIQRDDIKGRKLVASTEFSSYQVIFKSNPFVAVIPMEESQNYCYHCYKPLMDHKFQSISIKDRFYCSVKCRTAKYLLDRNSRNGHSALLEIVGYFFDTG